MDTVYLRGLRIDTVIGVHDWERGLRQVVVFDIELGTDIRVAAASDALADALDYQAVAARVQQLGSAHAFQLIETLAETVAATLLAEFPVARVVIQLAKPGALAHAIEAGVRIERHRS